MNYAALALALLGFAVGTMFRLRVILLILVLLLPFSIAFMSHGSSLLDVMVAVVAAQIIVQGSYFLGLVARAILDAFHHD
jgi:uncharacterized membrane protein YfbV (UPF0208 family)